MCYTRINRAKENIPTLVNLYVPTKHIMHFLIVPSETSNVFPICHSILPCCYSAITLVETYNWLSYPNCFTDSVICLNNLVNFLGFSLSLEKLGTVTNTTSHLVA